MRERETKHEYRGDNDRRRNIIRHPDKGDDASSAAERLGGPIEDERTADTATSAETGDDRQADRVAEEDEQRPDGG